MSGPLPRFSFVVACYNFQDYVAECLESILSQNYPKEHFEIICVDDGSTDRTPDILHDYAGRSSQIKVIRIQNSGLEKACNTGIRAAAHDYIIRVDSDDILGRDYLPAITRAIEKHPEFDFYYCKQYFEYYSADEKHAKSLPDFDPEEIFSRGDFFATATVYRKSDLAQVGFFPEAIKNCGLENYTVILSMLARKKRGFAVDGASFFYRRHHANMSTLKRQAIIEYGKGLLKQYGRVFQTNQYHPYGLKIVPEVLIP